MRSRSRRRSDSRRRHRSWSDRGRKRRRSLSSSRRRSNYHSGSRRSRRRSSYSARRAHSRRGKASHHGSKHRWHNNSQGGSKYKNSSPRRSKHRGRSISTRASRDDSSSVEDIGDDDLPGIVKYKKGDVIHNRYKTLKLAGQGTFGTTIYVYDMKRKQEVAMKIIRSVPRYLEDAQVEVDILTKLTESDPDSKSGIVNLYNSFPTSIRGHRHVCLVFEKLGKSLWDVIEHNQGSGFALGQVRDFGQQLFKAVAFCHKHKLTHTDLKPENILLADEVHDAPDGRSWRISSTETRLIDFGGATFHDEHHASMINTRQYRAPEVMLGLGWSYPSDIWSCGCILPELLTGTQLFQTHQNTEHFALMQKILGKPLDEAMALKALKPFSQHSRARQERSPSPESSHDGRGRSPSTVPVDKIFNFGGTLRWPRGASNASLKRFESAKPLEEQFRHRRFVDLLQKCLVYDPSKRILAEEAIKHPFFTESLEDDVDLHRRLR